MTELNRLAPATFSSNCCATRAGHARARLRAPLCGALLLGGSLLAAPVRAQDSAAPAPPTPAAAPAAPQHGQVKNGFVFAASGTLVVTLIADPRIGNLFVPSVQAGLNIGYKVDRVLILLGVEYGSTTETMKPAEGMEARSTSNSAFLIVPGMQVAVIRSADRRVELLGSARFGFGRTVSDQPLGEPGVEITPFSFMYEVGPGVRYWAHRHFAFNVAAGFRGDYRFLFENDTNKGTQTTTSVGTNGIFGSIGVMGVF